MVYLVLNILGKEITRHFNPKRKYNQNCQSYPNFLLLVKVLTRLAYNK